MRISLIARQQFGVFSRAQAMKAGFSRDAIGRRIRAGRWIAVYPGVYRLPGAPFSTDQGHMAAVLAGGPNAVLSHESAGLRWGLDGCRPGTPYITTTRNLSCASTIRVFRRRSLVPHADRATMAPIPLTTPARTVIDLAAIFSTSRLQHALDSALHRGLTTVEQLLWRLESLNSRGRPGTASLRALLEEASPNPTPHSMLERRFIKLAETAGISLPQRQFEIDIGWDRPIHVDFAYPPIKLAIETDGYGVHSSRSQWIADRRRDAALIALGWIVLRFSWDDVQSRPEYVVATIQMVLRQRAIDS